MNYNNEQYEQEKNYIKRQIESLINQGDIDNSKILINEFQKKLQGNDIDILNMKAIVSIIENNLEDAEKLLWEAINLSSHHSDAFVNLAYVYEIQGENTKASNFNYLAYHKTTDAHRKEELGAKIQNNHLLNKSVFRKFIVLSSCFWGEVLQRSHHISKGLSRLGYSVEYIQPVAKATPSIRDVSIANLMDYSNNNIRNIDLVNIISPISVNKIDNSIFDNYYEIIQNIIDKSEEEVIIICYLPSQINIIDRLSGNFKVVYDCEGDQIDLEPSYQTSKKEQGNEKLMLRRAEVVTCTSSALYLTKKINNENVYLMRNAVNIEDFMDEASMPTELLSIPEPRICYIGAVNERFDEELFYKLVRSNKDKSFVVIGNTLEGMLTNAEDNLYILGEKKHVELSSYLQHMNVGIIPYKDDTELSINCNPIKLYEYVMNGLPVVATNIPELILELNSIKISQDFDSFNQILNKSLNLEVDWKLRNEFVSLNTWTVRCEQLLKILNGETQQYSEELVLGDLRERWLENINETHNPLLESLLSLTFAKADVKQYYKWANESYKNLKIPFILMNYINSSILNGHIAECVKNIVDDTNVREIDRAELLYLSESNKVNYLKIRLLHIIGDYFEIRNILNSYSVTDNGYLYNLANYYYDIGMNDQSNIEYNKILGDFLYESPIYNKNMSEILISRGGILESRRFKEKEKMLISKYIKQFKFSTEKERPRFSIVIPTRNSPNVLKHTLMTCLDQDFHNYEIIVGDNSSDNLTKLLVEELDSSKIRYYKTVSELKMTDSFNFAISNAEGEYILVLGSDDGMLKHALKTLDDIIFSTNVNILHWNSVFYCWPDVKLEGQENLIHIPNIPSGRVNLSTIKYSEVVKYIGDYQLPYNAMPMLYCNAVVHRDIVLELKELTGQVFNGLIPDVYSGFALASIQEEYTHIDAPITIGGSSGKSTGISFVKPNLDNESKKIHQDFLTLNNNGVDRYSIIPDVPSVAVAVAEACLTARNSFGEKNLKYDLNRKKMLEQCAEELKASGSNLPIYLQKIYDSLVDDTHLQQWFTENYIENYDYYEQVAKRSARVYQKGFSPNGDLILDLSDFNITNVYGAAIMFSRITGW
ncbi:glycosyltransferase [Paenibacillus sp. FSL L8-0435]|uniref:glycosyltransferase n=1 Tax=Paenibacillus TaxID=44249 RepID=UPI001C8D2AC2|nr:glycosyltransferase [Paenibacillus xylanexedens]MBY0118828.1 glycosyltransferase [Paenibacillus xylanexedens]